MTDIVTLTAADFEWEVDADHKWPLLEDESGDYVFGFGHVNQAEFARLVNEFERYCDPAGADDWEHYETDVQHVFAVAYDQGGDVRWYWAENGVAVSADREGAFALTVLSR